MPLELPNIVDADVAENSSLTQPGPTPPDSTNPNDAASLWANIQKEEKKELLDYQTAKPYLNDLVKKWLDEEQRTESNRVTRDIDINIDQLREAGDVDDDECFIPERIIDGNIQRELPSYINFLKNSRRIAIFNDRLDATFDTQELEDAFTKGMTYKGWTKPHYKVLDGSLTHGWTSVEVVYDERYPLHCGVEYIAHEDLLFPLDSKDIQSASVVLRKYKVTPMQLKTWVVQFGFDLVQVNQIIQKYQQKTDKDKTISIFKRFCKHQGTVYVAWFSLDGATTDWLKKPIKLYAGIDKQVTSMVEVPNPAMQLGGMGMGMNIPPTIQQQQNNWVAQDLENYPLFLCRYRETEKPLIFDGIGRVFLDKDKQEAQTAIVTAFINGMNRAQKIYASPGGDTINDGKPAKQLSTIKWANGTIWDKPMSFWNMPYPDPIILKALQYFDVSNSQDIGQTDFAALNREDSRKTAREITAAQQAQTLLDSVDLTLYSEFIREVYSFSWLIVRSQALQNKIRFLLIKKPAPPQPMITNGMAANVPSGAPLPGQAMPQMQQQDQGSIVNVMGTYQNELNNYTNDVDTIVREYDIRAAGDVDVIQKAELVQQMMQDWPVVQATALGSRFLCDLMKLKYPQDGAIYSDILIQGDPKNAVIQSLGSLVTGLIQLPGVKEHIQSDPQMQAGLKQIQQQAQAALQTP